LGKSSHCIVISLCSFLLCLVLGIGIYGLYIEPSGLEVRHVWINDHEMGQMLQNKVVLQISDLHLNRIGVNETRLLKTIDALQPDIVFLTGDYVRWNGSYEGALDFLAKVKAKDGIWAVMGDYDYSNSRKSCLFCHSPGSKKPTERHGVKFLRNSLDKIVTPAGPMWIVGIDREADGGSFNEERLSFLMGKVPAIILSHNPLAFDLMDNNQNVLMLAGDTHGGQIPLPSWLWKYFGYEKNAQYEQGWFEKGKKKMYVTRGVGTSHFPIRFFRRPEITVFHFQATKSR
jgi:predicted MPP superfamily phosphohydrolase